MDFGKWGELIDVFLEKNSQINLSAIRDAEGVYVKHVLDSLELLKIFSFSSGQVVCDLGTGWGFPLLPLAIESPDVRFVGMDARKKKIDAIAAIVASLKLQAASDDFLENVDLVWSRVEEWSAGGWQQKAANWKLQETLYLASNNWIASSQNSSPQGHFLADAHSAQWQIPKKFDVVMARAVAHVEKLIPWMIQIVKKKGTLILYKEKKPKAEGLKQKGEYEILLELCQKYKISIQKEHSYVLEEWGVDPVASYGARRVIYILH